MKFVAFFWGIRIRYPEAFRFGHVQQGRVNPVPRRALDARLRRKIRQPLKTCRNCLRPGRPAGRRLLPGERTRIRCHNTAARRESRLRQSIQAGGRKNAAAG